MVLAWFLTDLHVFPLYPLNSCIPRQLVSDLSRMHNFVVPWVEQYLNVQL